MLLASLIIFFYQSLAAGRNQLYTYDVCLRIAAVRPGAPKTVFSNITMQLNSNQIAEILPQSYPFLMIDRVVAFRKGESLTAVKNITGDEWMFGGPRRETGLFPETLLIEAAAQAAILFYRLNKVEQNPQSKIFLGRAKAEFFKPVHIGDQLRLKTAAYKMLATSGYMDIQASVNEVDVANLEIMYSVIK